MFMNIDLEILLVVISIVLSLFLFFYSKSSLHRSVYSRYFLWITFLLPSYINLKILMHPEEILSPIGIFDMWFRHLSFYLGQWFIVLFLAVFFENYISDDKGPSVKPNNTKFILPTLFFIIVPTVIVSLAWMNINSTPITPTSFMYFITERGVQHILALLFFFSTAAYVRTLSLYPRYAAVKNFFNWFFLANMFFIFLHIFEYTQETLHLFPSISDEAGENAEAFIQYTAILLLIFSATKLSRIINGQIKN
jgi:hypothetical protein